MRVLSVRQPWASMIASGVKSIELRSWTTPYRGPVVILAGSSPWRGGHDYQLGPLGVSIAVVQLVDVRPAAPSDAAAACLGPPPGHHAWVLRDPRPLPAVSIKGRLGLYRLDTATRVMLGL